MKAVILFSETIHYGLAAANRVVNFAKGMERNGGSVEIVMPFGFFVKEDIAFASTGEYEKVKYRYLSYLPYHPSKFYPLPIAWGILKYYRFLGYLRYLWFLRTTKYDIVYFYRFGTVFSLLLLLSNKKKPAVSELCEIPYFNDIGFRKRANRLIREKFLFPFFDGFVVISEALFNYILKFKNKHAKVLKVPILIDEEINDLNSQPSSIEISGEYILHTGSLTEQKDGILGLIEACGKAFPHIDRQVKLVITSSLAAAQKNRLVLDSIEKWNLNNSVIFTGFLPKADLHHLLVNARVAVINKYKNEQNEFNFPSKLAEYLLYGIPVIASNVGEMNNYLKDCENSYVFDVNNQAQLVNKIILAFNSEKEYKQISMMGKKLALNEFGCTPHGKRLVEFFESIKNND